MNAEMKRRCPKDPRAAMNLVRERGGRGGSRCWWQLVGTVEEVVDVAGTHLCGLLMAVVGVLRG